MCSVVRVRNGFTGFLFVISLLVSFSWTHASSVKDYASLEKESYQTIAPNSQTILFYTLCTVSAILTGRRIHQKCFSRVKELQKIRSQIATDLHDDIGSGLSQIAIMTEVLARRMPSENAMAVESLRQIATASRELVDSMSDIVWCINPNTDNAENLIQRMRRFVNAILDGQDIIEFQFHVSGTDFDRKLPLDVRRHLFLVFKEAITNALRHSFCTSLKITIQVEQNQLFINIVDNGKGFDLFNQTLGNGVRNMRTRMKEVNGNLEIISKKGQGTIIRQLAPLNHPRFCWKKLVARSLAFRNKWNRSERLLRQST